MIYLVIYLIGCAVVAVGSLAALGCNGDHDTHVCPTTTERIRGTIVLTIGWPLVIPMFVAVQLRERRRRR